jgi:hypothetical protein
MISASLFRWNSEAKELTASKPKLTEADADFGLPQELAIDSESSHAAAIWTGTANSSATSLTVYHTSFDGEAWGEPHAAGKLEIMVSASQIASTSNSKGGAISIIVPNPSETGSRFETVVVHDGVAKQLMPVTSTMESGRPNVFMDDSGNAVMSVFLGSEFYVARYKQGSDAWGAFEQMTTMAPRWTQVIQPTTGKPIALWFDNTGVTLTVPGPGSMMTTSEIGHVYARFLQDDDTWSEAEDISGQIGADMSDNSLAGLVSDSGELTVFWSQIGGIEGASAPQRSIFSRRHTAMGWSEPSLVFAYTGRVSLCGMTRHDDTTALVWLQLNAGRTAYDLLWTHTLAEKSEP